MTTENGLIENLIERYGRGKAKDNISQVVNDLMRELKIIYKMASSYDEASILQKLPINFFGFFQVFDYYLNSNSNF